MSDEIEINTQDRIADQPSSEADGWEWMLLEIMGHRTHWGRVRQEERFGAKLLRIDVPKIISFERPDPSARPSGSIRHGSSGSRTTTAPPRSSRSH